MAAEDDNAEGETHAGENSPVSDELIGDDMPCIRCAYNLRGLKPVGQCPECGAKIEKTVAFINQRLLCPTCFQPNHPTNALCLNCRSPLTGSAATADYWRPKPMAVGVRRERPEDEEEEPEGPSLAWVYICWLISVPILVELASFVISVWTEPAPALDSAGIALGHRIISTFFIALLAMIPAAIMVFPTRNYFRLRREYVKKHEAFMAKEAAEDAKELDKKTADEAAEDDE